MGNEFSLEVTYIKANFARLRGFIERLNVSVRSKYLDFKFNLRNDQVHHLFRRVRLSCNLKRKKIFSRKTMQKIIDYLDT